MRTRGESGILVRDRLCWGDWGIGGSREAVGDLPTRAENRAGPAFSMKRLSERRESLGTMEESPAKQRITPRSAWRRPVGVVAWLALGIFVALAVDALHSRLPPYEDRGREEAFVPDPALARIFSLGFGAVVADFYWLQAIQAVGGNVQMTPELGDHLGRLIDVVTTLNPRVGHPYRFAAIWMTESEENVRTANRLLRRGIEFHPDDWRNHFYLGFNHFFYLLENQRAGEILERASAMPGAPRYLGRLSARLKSESEDLEVAAVFLREMLNTSEDQAAKEGYRAALDEIEVEQRARLLDSARVRFRERNDRDISTVADLVEGESPVLATLPSAEPSSLPRALQRGSRWQLDPASDRIVSAYYGKRYRLHVGEADRDRAERWAEERRKRERAEAVEGEPGKTMSGAPRHDR